jgi:CRP-like cAMP-binding protein
MSPFEKLFTVLSAVHPLSDLLKEKLSRQTKVGTFKRRNILLRPGEVANHIYFINKGLLRAYYVDEDGVETTFWLMKEMDMMASAFSFFTRQPGDLTIEVMEDCELVFIDYNTLEEVYKEYLEFNIVGRVLVQRYYALSDERAMILRMKRVIDRYSYMMEHYPDLMKRVYQKYMASYLDMTEATFSKTKKVWESQNS